MIPYPAPRRYLIGSRKWLDNLYCHIYNVDILVHWYLYNIMMVSESSTKKDKVHIERVQTGVRIEKRMLKVLKAIAEYLDMSLGDLIEGIVLHAFDGNPSPLDGDIPERIEMLKQVYDMDYDSSAAHNFIEID